MDKTGMTGGGGLSEHYRQAESLAGILARIDAALPAGLSPETLASLDQFHSGGLPASRELAAIAAIAPGEAVLDVGCGVGGPARLLAHEHKANVTAVDLSADYIAIARALSKKTGIAVAFDAADALRLPFAEASFDVVWTQHASTNIADKSGFYGELRRVLRPGGRLVFHDLLKGPQPGALDFPLPWADGPDESFLIEPAELRQLLPGRGFREKNWQDRTSATLAFFDKMGPPPDIAPPLGIHLLLGEGFRTMVANLRRNLAAGRLCAAMAVYEAVALGG
jgi:SAM-dependent methyltransferase